MDATGVINWIIKSGVMLGSILIVGGIGVLVTWMIIKYRKYSEFYCVIFERWGISFDSAGIFVDNKTNNKRFYMKKANVGLSPDNVPYKKVGNKKWVFLKRDGLKNFRYIELDFSEEDITPNVTEEDVNWAINAYDRQKKIFVDSMLMKVMPYAALIFVGIIVAVILIYVTQDVTKAAKEMAKFLAEARGTAIV